MESIFDLPTHTLVVHAPVVLEPLLAVLTLIVLTRQAWRKRFGWWLVAGVAAVAISVFVAMRSGEAFDELLDGLVNVSKHESLAETTRNLVLLWLAALIALVVVESRLTQPATASVEPGPVVGTDRGSAAVRLVVPLLASAVAVLAVLTTIWMIRTGHEGARVTWSGVIEQQRG